MNEKNAIEIWQTAELSEEDRPTAVLRYAKDLCRSISIGLFTWKYNHVTNNVIAAIPQIECDVDALVFYEVEPEKYDYVVISNGEKIDKIKADFLFAELLS